MIISSVINFPRVVWTSKCCVNVEFRVTSWKNLIQTEAILFLFFNNFYKTEQTTCNQNKNKRFAGLMLTIRRCVKMTEFKNSILVFSRISLWKQIFATKCYDSVQFQNVFRTTMFLKFRKIFGIHTNTVTYSARTDTVTYSAPTTALFKNNHIHVCTHRLGENIGGGHFVLEIFVRSLWKKSQKPAKSVRKSEFGGNNGRDMR